MPQQRTAAARLQKFREDRELSLREAARQLHVSHVTLMDWENEVQSPAWPYRDAIEIWTEGAIKATDWPPGDREREMAERAAQVKPVVFPKAAESGPVLESKTKSPKPAA